MAPIVALSFDDHPPKKLGVLTTTYAEVAVLRMCETVGWRWIMTRNWHYGDLKQVDVVGDGR